MCVIIGGMVITLLCIGDELLDGRILNTNQQTLSKLIWEAGYTVSQAVSVGDSMDVLIPKMTEVHAQSDIVICTGGLGSTEDDRTVLALSQMAHVNVVRSLEVEEMLRSFYAKRNRPMSESNLKQADIPEGSVLIPNQTGTAVGIQLKVGQTWFFLLPGVPREMNSMVSDHIIPFLDRTILLCKQQRVVKTFKCVGMGESDISDRLSSLYPLPSDIDIRYQVPFPEVHVQCCCDRSDDLMNLYEQVTSFMDDQLKDCCYTTTGLSFESCVVDLLKEKSKTIAIAESCTGGCVAQMMTLVPGSSAVFRCGVVAYSNVSKIEMLGVDSDDIDRYGAVSCSVAEAMAAGIREKSGADIGVSVTGIAGPEGGRAEKPVGTVCFAISIDNEIRSREMVFSGQRDQIQIRAAYYLLWWLFRAVRDGKT